MATKWKTVAPGIRVREHPTRKHGVRADRYFTLRITADGRQVEEALGWASEGWTLDRAQEELGKLREAKRTGKGPATLRERAQAERETERQAREDDDRRRRLDLTVADLWDRYSKEVIALNNKPRTATEKTRLWESRIKPALGCLKIREVTDQDSGAVVRAALRLNGSGQVLGGRAAAGNVYRLLHHVFHKSLLWGMRPRELGNPLENVDAPKVRRRERLLTSGEVGALLKALDASESDHSEKPQIVAVIRAAVLTGARISELLTLRWDYVDRDDRQLRLPDTKSDFSQRPLSAETLAVFDSVGRVPGVPYVFPSIKSPSKPLPYNTVEKAFRRIAGEAGVSNCTLHTVRHWFATQTANSVSNPRVGMALTGHKSHSAYMTYIHGDKDQARALADQLAKVATGLRDAEPNLIKMPKAVKG